MWDKCPRAQFWGHMVNTCLALGGNVIFIFQSVCIIFLLAMYEWFNFSTSFFTFGIVTVFYFSYPGRCAVISHSSFLFPWWLMILMTFFVYLLAIHLSSIWSICSNLLNCCFSSGLMKCRGSLYNLNASQISACSLPIYFFNDGFFDERS